MQGNSYINAYYHNNKIYHKYISEDGKRHLDAVNYEPILGYRVEEETGWTDVFRNNLKTIRFDSMKESREWKNSNKGCFDIYGDISHHISFLGQTYKGTIKPKKEFMKIFNFDIECYVEAGQGFPKASNPKNFINAITFQNMVTNHYYVFSLKDYTPKAENISYYKCNSESHLLRTIIDFIARMDVDILVGYNIEVFDIPYIVDRITLLLGEDEAKNLSPIKKVSRDSKIVNKREATVYKIEGIIIFDYLTLYQKFVFDNRESYSLDYISNFELGKEKLNYKEEFGDLNTLYDINFETFIDYNIKDVELVYLLDQKLKFIDIAIGYAYSMFTGLDDIFGTLKPWDSLLYHILYHKNILCNPNKASSAEAFMGGYVKEPIKGMHKWLTIYDIVSSYPNQIIQSNMSMETIVPDYIIDKNEDLKKIKLDWSDIDKCTDMSKLKTIQPILEKHGVTFTANGYFFKTDKQGFIPEIVEQIFNERVKLKKIVRTIKDKNEKEYIENLILILKIKINSLYGAISAPYFRWFDIRIASAVTYQGQLCVKGAGNYLIEKHPDLLWVYADTDSVQLSLQKIVERRFKNNIPDIETTCKFLLKYQDKIIEPLIEEFYANLNYNLNTFKPAVQMEHEMISDISIFIEKKKYATKILFKEGEWFLTKPKLKIKGIEVVRSSTPQVCRDKLKQAIELIFDTADNETLITFIDKFRNEFKTFSFEQVAFPRGVKFSDYTLDSKSLPIHVRAAFVFNKALKDNKLQNKYEAIGDGSKIKFCYIKEPNKFRSNIIGILDKMPIEFNDMCQIDIDLQFQKSFIQPLDKIFSAIGWVTEKTCNLDDFF